MYIKIMMTLAVLAGGHIGWQFYQDLPANTQNNLDDYKFVGDQLELDGVNSVRGLERVHIPKWREEIPQGLHNLSAFEVVNSQRTLRFDTHLKAEELMLSGEHILRDKRKERLINARVYLYSQEECKRLKEVLASACKLKNMEINITDDLVIHINYEFGFVQKNYFGLVMEPARLSYEEEHLSIYRIVDEEKFSVREQEEHRKKMYEVILNHCDKIRFYTGTCAIDDINFNYVSMDDDESRKNALEVNAVLTSLVSIENYEAEF